MTFVWRWLSRRELLWRRNSTVEVARSRRFDFHWEPGSNFTSTDAGRSPWIRRATHAGTASLKKSTNQSIMQPQVISQLPKLWVKIIIFMQGHVLIADADWSVAHFVVIMNDVMNDNIAAFAHVGARLGAFFYWTRFLENNVPFDNIPL